MTDHEPGSAEDVVEAIAQISAGGAVIVTGTGNRPGEAILVAAAETTTSELIAFYLLCTSGLVAVALTEMRARWLLLDATNGATTGRIDHLVSVDYRTGTTTGISAADRAATTRALADPTIRPADLTRPGHVLPLVERSGGLARWSGRAEAAVGLAVMAGAKPVAVLGDLTTPDRESMLAGDELVAFARHHDLPVVDVTDLAQHHRQSRRRLARSGEADLSLHHGRVHAIAYRDGPTGPEHLALVTGQLPPLGEVPVHVHPECVLGDAVGATACGCGRRLAAAFDAIGRAGVGVVIYLRGEDGHSLRFGHADDHWNDATTDGNAVDEILTDLGVRHVRHLPVPT